MKKEQYLEILYNLHKLDSEDEKIDYLEKVLETTDKEMNGLNDELWDLLIKLKNRKNNNPQ